MYIFWYRWMIFEELSKSGGCALCLIPFRLICNQDQCLQTMLQYGNVTLRYVYRGTKEKSYNDSRYYLHCVRRMLPISSSKFVTFQLVYHLKCFTAQ